MRQVVAIAIVASASLVPAAAGAGERVTDGALGAASGALVAGPVGFVAGGVIGFAAGPNIAHGMGLRHHRHYYDRHGRRSSGADRRNERAAEADPSGR